MWVAKILWYTYLDTGAMYRCATLYANRHWLLEATDEEKAAIVPLLNITFATVDWSQHTFINGEDVEHEIRKTDLALAMKPIVTCIPLRVEMIRLQKVFWAQGSIVIDARDAWTHIFPDAALKVFMTCDVDIRADRRVKQLQESWLPADLEKIKEEIRMRDDTDYLWPYAVNAKAPDARELDTSDLTIQEQIDQVVTRAKIEQW